MGIGDVARLTGLGADTLRYYEREGLMLDSTPRDGAGRRRYSSADLSWIGGLLMLRDTGMSVADMRTLAELSRAEGTERERLVVLESHRQRVVEELARTMRHLEALDTKISAYREAVGPATREVDSGRTER
ncbi:MerR family transcriptional regulator [Agromyces sp. MMS17-SY077]|uniref:MerR family transcriptional regulator n=2 Tax=Agromyces seonyuensis TaxID=2662446 RepID=A0A6I4P5A7_9MICO|nr:MerR family transcriptional regulator [Agromyces seonyuensis]